ncbi:hypothetical protein [Pseudomonas xionganensis]|uniref:hypothetical protein n=1 Tax=Pseudomonas xionganensis TaxID=2654845 RepID=UPI001E4F0EE2|nr:hypothetical protein [Pseudomonas xionganensis]
MGDLLLMGGVEFGQALLQGQALGLLGLQLAGGGAGDLAEGVLVGCLGLGQLFAQAPSVGLPPCPPGERQSRDSQQGQGRGAVLSGNHARTSSMALA